MVECGLNVRGKRWEIHLVQERRNRQIRWEGLSWGRGHTGGSTNNLRVREEGTAKKERKIFCGYVKLRSTGRTLLLRENVILPSPQTLAVSMVLVGFIPEIMTP